MIPLPTIRHFVGGQETLLTSEGENPQNLKEFTQAISERFTLPSLVTTGSQAFTLGLVGDVFSLAGYSLATLTGAGTIGRFALPILFDEVGSAAVVAKYRKGELNQINYLNELTQGLTARTLIQGMLMTGFKIMPASWPLRLFMLAGAMTVGGIAGQYMSYRLLGEEKNPFKGLNGYGVALRLLDALLIGSVGMARNRMVNVEDKGRHLIDETIGSTTTPQFIPKLASAVVGGGVIGSIIMGREAVASTVTSGSFGSLMSNLAPFVGAAMMGLVTIPIKEIFRARSNRIGLKEFRTFLRGGESSQRSWQKLEEAITEKGIDPLEGITLATNALSGRKGTIGNLHISLGNTPPKAVNAPWVALQKRGTQWVANAVGKTKCFLILEDLLLGHLDLSGELLAEAVPATLENGLMTGRQKRTSGFAAMEADTMRKVLEAPHLLSRWQQIREVRPGTPPFRISLIHYSRIKRGKVVHQLRLARSEERPRSSNYHTVELLFDQKGITLTAFDKKLSPDVLLPLLQNKNYQMDIPLLKVAIEKCLTEELVERGKGNIESLWARMTTVRPELQEMRYCIENTPPTVRLMEASSTAVELGNRLLDSVAPRNHFGFRPLLPTRLLEWWEQTHLATQYNQLQGVSSPVWGEKLVFRAQQRKDDYDVSIKAYDPEEEIPPHEMAIVFTPQADHWFIEEVKGPPLEQGELLIACAKNKEVKLSSEIPLAEVAVSLGNAYSERVRRDLFTPYGRIKEEEASFYAQLIRGVSERWKELPADTSSREECLRRLNQFVSTTNWKQLVKREAIKNPTEVDLVIMDRLNDEALRVMPANHYKLPKSALRVRLKFIPQADRNITVVPVLIRWGDRFFGGAERVIESLGDNPHITHAQIYEENKPLWETMGRLLVARAFFGQEMGLTRDGDMPWPVKELQTAVFLRALKKFNPQKRVASLPFFTHWPSPQKGDKQPRLPFSLRGKDRGIDEIDALGLTSVPNGRSNGPLFTPVSRDSFRVDFVLEVPPLRYVPTGFSDTLYSRRILARLAQNHHITWSHASPALLDHARAVAIDELLYDFWGFRKEEPRQVTKQDFLRKFADPSWIGKLLALPVMRTRGVSPTTWKPFDWYSTFWAQPPAGSLSYPRTFLSGTPLTTASRIGLMIRPSSRGSLGIFKVEKGDRYVEVDDIIEAAVKNSRMDWTLVWEEARDFWKRGVEVEMEQWLWGQKLGLTRLRGGWSTARLSQEDVRDAFKNIKWDEYFSHSPLFKVLPTETKIPLTLTMSWQHPVRTPRVWVDQEPGREKDASIIHLPIEVEVIAPNKYHLRVTENNSFVRKTGIREVVFDGVVNH